jgi:ataxin-10
MSDEDSELVAQWKQACTTFDITVSATISALVSKLDAIANVLARNEQARYYWNSAAMVLSDP